MAGGRRVAGGEGEGEPHPDGAEGKQLLATRPVLSFIYGELQLLGQIIAGMKYCSASSASVDVPRVRDSKSVRGNSPNADASAVTQQMDILSELLTAVLLPLHLPNGIIEWRDQVPVIKASPPSALMPTMLLTRPCSCCAAAISRGASVVHREAHQEL
jgi:hypothetical protein